METQVLTASLHSVQHTTVSVLLHYWL